MRLSELGRTTVAVVASVLVYVAERREVEAEVEKKVLLVLSVELMLLSMVVEWLLSSMVLSLMLGYAY